MPGKYYSYYQQVADRMAPYLGGRRVSIEHRYPGSTQIVFRRHPSGANTTQWIYIDEPQQIVDWVWQYAEGFHGHVRAEDGPAWFVIDVDARNLPLAMARLATAYAAGVLEKQGLAPLVVSAVMDTIRELKSQRVSMLLVEQNAEVALQLADRVYVIDHGTVLFEGAPAQLRADASITATYLGVGGEA